MGMFTTTTSTSNNNNNIPSPCQPFSDTGEVTPHGQNRTAWLLQTWHDSMTQSQIGTRMLFRSNLEVPILNFRHVSVVHFEARKPPPQDPAPFSPSTSATAACRHLWGSLAPSHSKISKYFKAREFWSKFGILDSWAPRLQKYGWFRFGLQGASFLADLWVKVPPHQDGKYNHRLLAGYPIVFM